MIAKNKSITCCFTGHREGKYNFRQNKEIIMKALDAAIEEAINKGYKHFIEGNATGVDTWAGKIVVDKKNKYKDITLSIIEPFRNHNADVVSEEYAYVHKYADEIITLDNKGSKFEQYNLRNKYLVDNSSYIIGVYDPEFIPMDKGGTYKTLEYAFNSKIDGKIIAWNTLIYTTPKTNVKNADFSKGVFFHDLEWLSRYI